MKSNTALKRGLLAAASVAVFVAVLVAARTNSAEKEKEEKKASGDWVMFGGTLQRNFVNTTDRDISDDWDIEEKKNVLWEASPGSKAYGGPTVAGGKVFIGTNNHKPRDPGIKGDKGVVMCFDEKTGKFLWQIVFDKLAIG